jgi:hypothetical protein
MNNQTNELKFITTILCFIAGMVFGGTLLLGKMLHEIIVLLGG